jgi:hypothetical protein
MSGKDFNKEYELMNKTCEALLLQFRTPQVYDLSIPDATNIKYLVTISGRIINGESIKPEEITCVTANPRYCPEQYWRKGKFFSSLSSRVSDGINLVLEDDRETEPFLELTMRHSSILSHEWYPGKGTLFRFRDGKRNEISEEVLKYFDGLEWGDFQKIGNLFQPYIERVGAPHEHKE